MSEQMNMQKVVDILKDYSKYYIYCSELVDAITFLENEMKEKTCEGCEYDIVYAKNRCGCARENAKDKYTPKEPTNGVKE